MRSKRLSSQIGTLSTQLGLGNLLKQCYEDATHENPYAYLAVDFSNRADPKSEKLAIKTNIFPDNTEPVIIYRGE
jgi:hypothetical protein